MLVRSNSVFAFGAWALALGLAAGPAGAQTLREAVEAAWQRAADAAPSASGEAAALERRSLTDRWLSGPPALALSERSDRWASDRGRRTREVELSLPLWRPGQRDVNARLADSEGELAGAELALSRWTLAGEVRDAIGAAALASAEADFARQRLAVVEKIAAEVGRHIAVGDLARADGLLVDSEKLAAQGALIEATRRAEEAARRYRRLTGLATWPAPGHRPTPSSDAASDADHPRLRHAERALRRSRDARAALAPNADGAPELSLAVERERDQAGAPESSQVRLGLKIPLGGARWQSPAQAAAAAQEIRAELDLQRVRAAIDADRDDAKAALAAADQALALSRTRQQATEQHAELLRKGFALGEIGAAALLRGESQRLDATAEATRQQLLFDLAHSRLEHHQGRLP